MNSARALPLVTPQPANMNAINALAVKDLLTFEFVFMLFLYAGSIKRVPPLTEIDITIAAAGVGMLWGLLLLLRRINSISKQGLKYLLLHTFLVLWALTSYSLYGSGPYSAVKIQKVTVMSSWGVIAPLLFINTGTKIQSLLRLVVGMSLVAVVFGLAQAPAGNQITMWGQDNYQPLGRTCGLALLIVLGWGAFNGSLKFWLLHLPLCAALFITLFLSGARQAALGLAMGGGALSLGVAIRLGWMKIAKTIFLALVCIAVLVAIFQLSLFPRLESRLAGNRIAQMLTVGEQQGWHPEEEHRPKLWEAGWQLWLKYPLSGAGIGAYYDYVKIEPWGDRWPHNLFLEWLSELGVIGFLLGIMTLAIPIAAWLRGCKDSSDGTVVTLGAIMVFLIACSMFSWDWPDNRDLFTFGSLLLVSTAANKRTK
jgi:O-antigen ligase